MEQGNAALQAGKPEDALAHYDKAVAKLPAEAGVHFDRGAALYALSRFEEAGKEFLRATEGQDEGLKAAAFRSLGQRAGQAGETQGRRSRPTSARSRCVPTTRRRSGTSRSRCARRRRKRRRRRRTTRTRDKDKKDDKDKDKTGQETRRTRQDKDKDKDKDKKDDKDKDKQDKDKDEKDKQDKDKQEKQPQPEKAAENQPERIQEMLKNLEANPKDLERERARMRAVRRGPPARDW